MTSRLDPAAPAEVRVFTERLRKAVADAGYPSLRAFATDADLSPSTVSEAFNGRRVPSWDTVVVMLRTCDRQPTREWRDLVDAARAALQGVVRPTPPRGPGLFSVRPPTGALPTRVRGRDAVLARLTGLLTAPEPVLQVLCGLGGCGKTTIALELARRAGELGLPVFWVSAAQRGGLTDGLKEVTCEVGVPHDAVERAWAGHGSAVDLLWRRLDALDAPWLLVVDNADEPGLLAGASGLPGDGTGWARPSRTGTTVLTSRVSGPEVWGSQAELHQVEVLGAPDAADVLTDLAGDAGDRRDALALADRLGGLPLALHSAGVYLSRAARGGGRSSRITTFDAYRQEMGNLGTGLLDEGAPRTTDVEHLHRALVGRTWEMSLDLLEARGVPHVRALMRLLSCFAAAPLPVDLVDESVLGGSVVPEDVDRALEALVDHTMLAVVRNGRLSCLVGHRMVLEATADRLRGRPDAEQAATWRAAARLVTRAAEPAPEEGTNWDWWRLLLPHVAALVTAVPDTDEEVLVEVLRAGVRGYLSLAFSGVVDDAGPYSRLVLSRALALPEDHEVRLAARHRAANSDLALTDADLEAEYGDIAARQTAVLGEDHLDTLITRHQLAMVVANTRDLGTAVDEVRRIVSTCADLLGPVDPYTLSATTTLVSLLTRRGELAEATALLRAMVARCRELRGDGDHLTMMWTLSLTESLVRDWRLEEATEVFGHLPVGSAVPPSARARLASTLRRLFRLPDAEREYRALLEQLSATGSERTHLYRDSLTALALCVAAQGRADEAVALHAAAIAACPPLPGYDEHHVRLRADHAVLRVLAGKQEGMVAELRALLADADDAVLAQIIGLRLVEALEAVGDNAEAERERLLRAAESVPGTCALFVAQLLERKERRPEALEAYRRYLAGPRRVFDDHDALVDARLRVVRLEVQLDRITPDEALAAELPDQADQMQRLLLDWDIANARTRSGEPERAVEDLVRVVERGSAAGPSMRGLVANALWQLAVLLEGLKRCGEALAAYQRCVELRAEFLAADDSAVQACHRMITRLRLALGEITAAEAVVTWTALLPGYTRDYGERGENTLWLRNEIASARYRAGDVAGAEADRRDLVDACRPGEEITRTALWRLAWQLLDQERYADALPVLENCLAEELSTLDSNARPPLGTRRRITQCRYALGLISAAEAVAEYEAVLPGLIEHDGVDGKVPTEVRATIAALTS